MNPKDFKNRKSFFQFNFNYISIIVFLLALLLSKYTNAQQAQQYSLTYAKEILDKLHKGEYSNTEEYQKLYNLSKEIYKDAANNGNADAQYLMSKWCSESERQKWLTLAAEQEHPLAQFDLSEFFHFGLQGQTIDLPKAEQLLRRAASQGHPFALVRIVQHFCRNNIEHILNKQLASIFEMLFREQIGDDRDYSYWDNNKESYYFLSDKILDIY